MKDIYLYIVQRIHPGSIIAVVAIDLFWSFIESGLTASLAAIIFLPLLIGIVFATGFIATALIQRFGSGDEWVSALAKGVVLGILAAVPYFIVGGISIIGWGFISVAYGVNKEMVLLGKLTHSWRKIEGILRKSTPLNLQFQGRDEVINYLYSQGVFSAEIKNHLHVLRKQRNINVHLMSTDELENLVNEVQEMEKKLYSTAFHR